MWLTGPVAPRHVGSSQTRARTRVSCVGRQILNHCATREARFNFLKRKPNHIDLLPQPASSLWPGPAVIWPTPVSGILALQSPSHCLFQPTAFPAVLPICQVPSCYRAFADTGCNAPALQPPFGYLMPTHSSNLKNYFLPHVNPLLILR